MSATILTWVLTAIGWSKYTDWALKVLPYITQYGPIVVKFLENASASWESFKSQYPKFGTAIEGLAKRWFPKENLETAVTTTLKGIFAPHKMTPEEEERFHNRGMLPRNPDIGDFPQTPN